MGENQNTINQLSRRCDQKHSDPTGGIVDVWIFLFRYDFTSGLMAELRAKTAMFISTTLAPVGVDHS